MKEKRDIGNLIKDKLDNQLVNAPETGWDRIEKSLDGKKKKRRGYFILLLCGLALIPILLLFNKRPTDGTRNITDQEQEIQIEIPESESILPEEILADSTDKSQTQFMTDAEIKLKTSDQIESETKQNKKSGLDSFTESKTTYFYFRSSDNKNVVSEDRQVIDSLMREEINTITEADSLQ